MRATLLIRLAEFYIGMTVLVGSGAALGWALRQRDFRERSVSLLQEPLHLGPHEYALVGPGGCVGKAMFSLVKQEGEIDLQVVSLARTEARGRKATIEFDGDFTFNLLGQLGGGVVKARIGETNATLGFENIDPIKVTIVSSLLAPPGRREFEVPGPVQLVALGGGAYQLQYLPLAGRQAPAVQMLAGYSSYLGLAADDSVATRRVCEGSPEGSLHLDRLVEALEGQSALLSKFFPPGAFGEGGN